MYPIRRGTALNDALRRLDDTWAYLAHIVADAGDDPTLPQHHALPVIGGTAAQHAALVALAGARQDARRNLRAATRETIHTVYDRACKALVRATAVKGAPTLGTTAFTEGADGRWLYNGPAPAPWTREDPNLDVTVVVEDTTGTPYIHAYAEHARWSMVIDLPRVTIRYSGSRHNGASTTGMIIARNAKGAGVFPVRVNYPAHTARSETAEGTGAPVEAPSESPEEPPSGE